MELSKDTNLVLEALAYLGARANGHTLAALGERLRNHGISDSRRFEAASRELSQLVASLDAQINIPQEQLKRLFGDIEGFPYSTIGSYSPAFLLFYPLLSRADGPLDRLTSGITRDQAAKNIMTTLSLIDQAEVGEGSQELVSRVLALTIPPESRLKLLDVHQNYQQMISEISDCLKLTIKAMEEHREAMEALCSSFFRQVSSMGCENYLRETSSLDMSEEKKYHVLPFIFGPDTNLSVERPDGSQMIYCGILRLTLRQLLADDSGKTQVYDVLKIIGDRTRFDILCYLSENPSLYGQQLCEHFGLAKNTIHHHMSKLVNAGLVTCAVEGNRVYYTADRHRLDAAITTLRTLLLGGE